MSKNFKTKLGRGKGGGRGGEGERSGSTCSEFCKKEGNLHKKRTNNIVKILL